jgi:hypothetical protein
MTDDAGVYLTQLYRRAMGSQDPALVQQHVVALPMSQHFLQMRLAPGGCVDDGDVRPWT